MRKIVKKIWHYETIDFTLPTFQRTSTYILKLLSIKHYRDPLAIKYKFPIPNYPKNYPLSGKHGLVNPSILSGEDILNVPSLNTTFPPPLGSESIAACISTWSSVPSQT